MENFSEEFYETIDPCGDACVIGEEEMPTIAILYGSNTGATERVAEMIRDRIGANAVTLDVTKVDEATLEQFDSFIIGVSTWEWGELQGDMEDFLPLLDEMDFSNRKVALFGLGNQEDYADTFADGLGTLYEELLDRGAQIIGAWPAEDYHFVESRALVGGKFVGLVIDEDTQENMTSSRVKVWVDQIRDQIEH